MDKSRSKMSEVIIFKVPKSVKEELEQFCKINGYNISDAVRMAIENQYLAPDMKTQAELWKEMLEWKDWVNKRLGEIVSLISESWKLNQEDIKKLTEISEGLFKSQEKIAECLSKIEKDLKLMDVRTKFLYDTFIEYLEAKVKQKKET
jgi:hypothetical protein